MVRNSKLFLGFYSDDLSGVTNLTASRWHHITFAFESSTRNQSVYLDGVLDGSRIASSVYEGANGSLNIGMRVTGVPKSFFNGLIDQFSFINRTKTSRQILRDATLTLYFSFDGNSIYDQGPLGINGSLAGSNSFVPGRQGQALQICNSLDSYFMVEGLVLLGRDDQFYSFSIWVKPAVLGKSSIIHMSSLP